MMNKYLFLKLKRNLRNKKKIQIESQSLLMKMMKMITLTLMKNMKIILLIQNIKMEQNKIVVIDYYMKRKSG